MIDVYLLSGFLGSGKTSLLVKLISQLKEHGKKPAILMNEFGLFPLIQILSARKRTFH